MYKLHYENAIEGHYSATHNRDNCFYCKGAGAVVVKLIELSFHHGVARTSNELNTFA